MNDASDPTANLPDDVGALKALIGVKDLEIERLKEELQLLLHKRFGASSEKADPDQLHLFNEAEATAATTPEPEARGEITVPEYTRNKGGRKPLPDALPRVRIEHDIADTEKPCPCGSGDQRPRIGEVVTEQADIIPAQVQVLQHVRFKYGPCRECGGVFPDDAKQTAPRAIIVAPLPTQPIPKSLASPGTCAFLTSAKYEDGLPLYRLEKILARHGIDISRATLASWMIRLGDLIVPLINLMSETQLTYDILQMDETTVQVLKEDGRAPQTKSYMWVRRGGSRDKPIILFDYEPSRSAAVPFRLLEDFKGYLQTDGYEGYTKVGQRDGIVHVGCLAHARRKFDEALKAQRKTGRGGLAAEGLALIQQIYKLEKVAREAGLTLEQRQRLRDEQTRPVLDELRQWLDARRKHAPPSTLVGKAMTYLDTQWPRLIRILDDRRLEVDNNLCENAIRPFVMGRKAWLFSDTPAGADASARLYSLIETAKANGCEPYAYLRHIFTELPKATTLAEIETLLPWNVFQHATQSVAA